MVDATVVETSHRKTRHGKLHIISGPMGAEKSTELARLVLRQRRALRSSHDASEAVVVLVPATRMRFSGDGSPPCLETRNGVRLDAYALDLDQPLCENAKRADVAEALASCSVIAIDEGQMFSGLSEFCENYLALGKNIVVAALELTSERAAFGEIPFMVAQAEKHTRLSAVCTFCGARAIFTVCRVEKKGDVLIGGDSEYRAACRTCWTEHHSDGRA